MKYILPFDESRPLLLTESVEIEDDIVSARNGLTRLRTLCTDNRINHRKPC